MASYFCYEGLSSLPEGEEAAFVLDNDVRCFYSEELEVFSEMKEILKDIREELRALNSSSLARG